MEKGQSSTYKPRNPVLDEIDNSDTLSEDPIEEHHIEESDRESINVDSEEVSFEGEESDEFDVV